MKSIFFAILIATTAFGFEDDSNSALLIASAHPLPSNPPIQDKPFTRNEFYYVRFAAAESNLIHMGSIYPGLGIGYRRLAGDGAADISIGGVGHAERRHDRFLWTCPKASYIHYLQPSATESAYIGGGLAWGGLSSRDLDFIGIIPCVTCGYEFARKTSVLGFTELTVSQPAISVYREGSFPGPFAELSVGVGF